MIIKAPFTLFGKQMYFASTVSVAERRWLCDELALAKEWHQGERLRYMERKCLEMLRDGRLDETYTEDPHLGAWD